jgi:uncharacterized protein YqjF (DUF2071 family)
MRMIWSELLFAHWAVPAAELRARVPRGLELDLFDGRAWLGVVPFRMAGVRSHSGPSLGFAEDFLELNVRTYVRCGDKPGVWFFSLDAGSALAVAGARAVFHLPYFTAHLRSKRLGARIEFSSERTPLGAGAARFQATYEPCGPVVHARAGTLEHFLTERYCLYALDSGSRVLRGEIDHAPWPLQPAAAVLEVETVTVAAGIARPADKPLLHYAERLDVRAWAPQVVG